VAAKVGAQRSQHLGVDGLWRGAAGRGMLSGAGSGLTVLLAAHVEG
jgi:hypothetical protein